jgi:putative transposase
MESGIINYQQQQHEVIGKISSQVEVCAAADETFFDQVILVMLDLPSGYIFMDICLKFITTDGDYPVSDYKSQLLSIISRLNGMMAQLLRRDYLVEIFLTCLRISLKILVSYLNQESRENHPSLKLKLCLLSRFKLVAEELIEITKNLSKKWGVEIIEINGEEDHLHILFSYYPQMQLSKYVNNLKTVTSRLVNKNNEDYLSTFY